MTNRVSKNITECRAQIEEDFKIDLSSKRTGNLDIFWLKDDALGESANLPSPAIIAADSTADLEAALEQFRHDRGKFEVESKRSVNDVRQM